MVVASVAVIAQGAELVGPSRFYIVSEFFSDNGARLYYRLIDVSPDGSDSVIRYARIAPADAYCPHLGVQATEGRVRDESPAQLVGRNNPCAVEGASLRAALNEYRQRGGGFEFASFGIVAQCGHSSVTLRLPSFKSVNLERMKSSYPAMVRLWDLGSEITALVFGPNDIFQDRSEKDDLVLQRAGEKLVPELISGRYDRGLAAAAKGNVGTGKRPSFRSLLANYRGPVPAAEARVNHAPRLLDATEYRFTNFVTPKYPPLAAMARIEGKVELRLAVGSTTGDVHGVSVISGHPLLAPTAVDAAKQWRFAANSISSDTVIVTIEYALRCEDSR